MKNKNLWIALSILALTPALAQAHSKDTPPENRISQEKARQAAKSYYAGKIESEELEFEGGKWIYSFDLKKSNDQRVHEIHVDAISGKVLDAHTETASDESKEAQEDNAAKSKVK